MELKVYAWSQKMTFGKITGDKDKSWHMERHDQPFKRVEKIIVLIAWLNKMPYDYKRDQKGFIVIK